jgi:hypothetical protein
LALLKLPTWTSKGTAIIGVQRIATAGSRPGSSKHDVFVAGDPALAPSKAEILQPMETMVMRRIADPGLFQKVV